MLLFLTKNKQCSKKSSLERTNFSSPCKTSCKNADCLFIVESKSNDLVNYGSKGVMLL